MKCTLVKFTLLAAFENRPLHKIDFEALGDRLAELLRDERSTLTVASEYDDVVAEVEAADDSDDLVDALAQHFPDAALALGPVAGIRVLGRNGTFKKARLEHNATTRQLELWLGTEKERYPLVVFPRKDAE